MSKKYQHLLSPVKVGDVIFKNRMTASPSMPHFIQGPETYPAEGFITHYANKAKNGAAWVVCSESGLGPGLSRDMQRVDNSASMDPFDRQCQNYYAQQAEAIHFYGAKAAMFINVNIPGIYDVSTGIPSMIVGMGKHTPPASLGEEIPVKLLDKIAEDFAV
jgi:2,4-dienoyl-CoA reductase-like NADH-dependent reductase (Old Yellow Enzyme family)